MRKSKNEYTHRTIYLTFAVIFLAGAVGLGTVWMRHLIAEAASETRNMETRLAEVDRSLSRLNSEIASALNPSFLQHQMQRFDLDLRRPEESQIVRLEAPSGVGHFADGGASGPEMQGDAMAYNLESGRSNQ